MSVESNHVERVIKGWDEGEGTMSVRGKRDHPDLAYGGTWIRVPSTPLKDKVAERLKAPGC